jgi:bifunctional DNase/RNase
MMRHLLRLRLSIAGLTCVVLGSLVGAAQPHGGGRWASAAAGGLLCLVAWLVGRTLGGGLAWPRWASRREVKAMRCQECQAAATLHVTDASGRSVVAERHLCEEHARRFLADHPVPPQDIRRRTAGPPEGIVAAPVVEGIAATPARPPVAASESEVDIGRVIISETHEQQALFLREVGTGRVLPVMCGIFEATTLDRTLKGLPVPRPLTHDAWAATVAALGGEVQDVRLHDLREHTYVAEVRIRQAGRLVAVDVRPSDAFVLALKCGVPILVAERLMAEGGTQQPDPSRQRSGAAAVVAPGNPPGPRWRTVVLVLGLLALLLFAALFTAYWQIRGYDDGPVYHDKRLPAWVDQALEDTDPEARREAAEVLREVLPQLHDDALWQFLLRFVKPKGDPQATPLPKEVHPFLIEALAYMPNSYPAMALEWRAGPDTVPALIEALKTQKDPSIRRQAADILGRLGPRAKEAVPALRDALQDEDEKVRKEAAAALKKLAGDPGDGKPRPP